jgi:hypothetical protein
MHLHGRVNSQSCQLDIVARNKLKASPPFVKLNSMAHDSNKLPVPVEIGEITKKIYEAVKSTGVSPLPFWIAE